MNNLKQKLDCPKLRKFWISEEERVFIFSRPNIKFIFHGFRSCFNRIWTQKLGLLYPLSCSSQKCAVNDLTFCVQIMLKRLLFQLVTVRFYVARMNSTETVRVISAKFYVICLLSVAHPLLRGWSRRLAAEDARMAEYKGFGDWQVI